MHWLHLGIVALFGTVGMAQAELPELPDDCWGVYSWASWKPQSVTRDTCPHVVGVPIILQWNSIEPEEGNFQFDALLGDRLKLAERNGFYVFTMLWVGPAAPRWIYDKGVPEVECTPTINPRGEVRTATYPYYFDEDHKRYFHRLIREYGKYVLSLPENLRRRIIFLQVAEGSTGDGYGYKGDPLDDRYAISREAWGKFRIETWEVHKEAFSKDGKLQMRFLVNDDSSQQEQHHWLMRNLDTIGCKQGMFSHGYHISDSIERLGQWREYTSQIQQAGKSVFSRGEQDAEWQVCGWSRKNPLQGLYWTALLATHCGLDIWNVPSAACEGDTYAPALRFFNKYAGKKDAATAPAAFCALRRGLDASDVVAYPEETFGEADKKNIDRYVKIADAFADYGAYQGDPPAATGGGMKNRQRKDYNDVGWGILPGNYRRFLEQIEPERSSVAWWHVGPPDHHYSRFARGFDHNRGKTAMFFNLDDAFFAEAENPVSVRIRVAYLDRGNGRWALHYAGKDGQQTAARVSCRDSGRWQEEDVVLTDAFFNNGLPKGSDLMLEYLGGDDTVFHIIELDRT